MKKTLAAIAVLGAFAGSTLAADVTLYGVVDTGFQYNHTNPADKASSSKFSMESGQSAGSRWGLKGVEDLGAFKVGFILEDGFSSDTGAESGVMFDRESSLFIEGGFGKVAVGRIGSIGQGTSSWGKVGVASPFGTSYKNAALTAVIVTDSAVRNNMVAYESPSIAGLKFYAQYGMGDTVAEDKTDEDNLVYAQVENESSTDRYYALGATYANGPINAYFAVDSINYKSYKALSGDHNTLTDVDDSLTVTAAVNYNFDVAKVFFGAQYFDEVANEKIAILKTTKLNGWSATVGTDVPLAGGNLMAAIGYVDAEAADSVTKNGKDKAAEFDLTRYQLAVGYKYNLSKRTMAYAAASLLKDKVEKAGKDDAKTTTAQAMFGLKHTF